MAAVLAYPERFVQQAPGHNSKAVHYAYSKHAEVTVPSLDDWEKQWKRQPVARDQHQRADGREHGAKSLERGGIAMPKPAEVQLDFQAAQAGAVTADNEMPVAAVALGG